MCMIQVAGLRPGESLTIRYRDSSGAETSRRITMLNRTRRSDGDIYLRAYCHLRQEERTFLASRIVGFEDRPPGARASGVPAAAAAPRPAKPQARVSSATVAVAPAPTPPPASTAGAPARPSRHGGGRSGGGRGGGFLLALAILAVGLWWIEENDGRVLPPMPPGPVPVPGPGPTPSPPPAVVPSPAPVPLPRPPRPKPPPAEYQVTLARRIGEFTAATGISDVRVISRYSSADTNYDGELAWEELRVFQRRLVAEFPYRANLTAYSPTDFLSHGSGDCEDFALFTCGLLRFWGVDCYLGSLQADGYAIGHAIALVKVTEVPRGFAYYEIDAAFVAGSPGVAPGIYVPVDYEQVGGLSNAVGPGWTLRWMRVPETAYGLYM